MWLNVNGCGVVMFRHFYVEVPNLLTLSTWYLGTPDQFFEKGIADVSFCLIILSTW